MLTYLSTYFFHSGLAYPEVGDWIRKAYTNVTEVVELPLLCDPSYFNIYLTWINFFVKFLIPTVILLGCNIRILSEVSYILLIGFSLIAIDLGNSFWIHFKLDCHLILHFVFSTFLARPSSYFSALKPNLILFTG